MVSTIKKKSNIKNNKTIKGGSLLKDSYNRIANAKIYEDQKKFYDKYRSYFVRPIMMNSSSSHLVLVENINNISRLSSKLSFGSIINSLQLKDTSHGRRMFIGIDPRLVEEYIFKIDYLDGDVTNNNKGNKIINLQPERKIPFDYTFDNEFNCFRREKRQGFLYFNSQNISFKGDPSKIYDDDASMYDLFGVEINVSDKFQKNILLMKIMQKFSFDELEYEHINYDECIYTAPVFWFLYISQNGNICLTNLNEPETIYRYFKEDEDGNLIKLARVFGEVVDYVFQMDENISHLSYELNYGVNFKYLIGDNDLYFCASYDYYGNIKSMINKAFKYDYPNIVPITYTLTHNEEQNDNNDAVLFKTKILKNYINLKYEIEKELCYMDLLVLAKYDKNIQNDKEYIFKNFLDKDSIHSGNVSEKSDNDKRIEHVRKLYDETNKMVEKIKLERLKHKNELRYQNMNGILVNHTKKILDTIDYDVLFNL